MIEEVDQKKLKKEDKWQAKDEALKQKFTEIKEKQSYLASKEELEWRKSAYFIKNNVDISKTNFQELHELLKKTFRHARRRENFFTNVDRHPDNTLRCVYSGKILSNEKGDMLQKCDEEHSFPQSFQRGSKAGTGRDMHAIFAAYKNANGSRGNLPFGNKGDVVEISEYGTILKFKGNKFYNPKINASALARASLYILTCYAGCANPKYFPKQSLEWMIEEGSKKNVSEWEMHRNEVLFELQQNRNPFIDWPELCLQIDFSKGWQAGKDEAQQ